ncbi:LytTR family DNA-binding domain-containing protein [Sphingobacterium sp. lm-10]|uniref:LytR/AlgR family response regulator transcription factor n=1 Tax=Sphingobacterium sp. lm-10 TaxID=2944904 RepID=UPI002020B74C|nr:LytTR family DNA-binding domain-containing protein [Sphingobacterium sp. lm-10]MCL7986655.1 LytTR family DNA-binding domain-containing protein [Sphingobacterium sp. lm-10]
MKVLIVEDETAAYDSLIAILSEIDPSISIVGNTEGVAQTIQWLQTQSLPDLIFMDIHLSDGHAFMLFEEMLIDVPIIFTTAYDTYAIDAFKVNSVDYLLKPLMNADVESAINKWKRRTQQEMVLYQKSTKDVMEQLSYPEKLLVPQRDKLMPIALNSVACFYTTEKNTSLHLDTGIVLRYAKTLEQITSSLNPKLFYRANKQFIIARESVVDVVVCTDSRLQVNLNIAVPEIIFVSKNRAADFKEWLIQSK